MGVFEEVRMKFIVVLKHIVCEQRKCKTIVDIIVHPLKSIFQSHRKSRKSMPSHSPALQDLLFTKFAPYLDRHMQRKKSPKYLSAHYHRKTLKDTKARDCRQYSTNIKWNQIQRQPETRSHMYFSAKAPQLTESWAGNRLTVFF